METSVKRTPIVGPCPALPCSAQTSLLDGHLKPVPKVSVLHTVDCKCKGHIHNCRSCIVYNCVAAVIEEVSSKPFGADPQVMMSIIKGLYSLKPGDIKIISELINNK